jgi:hypothetical protein
MEGSSPSGPGAGEPGRPVFILSNLIDASKRVVGLILFALGVYFTWILMFGPDVRHLGQLSNGFLIH